MHTVVVARTISDRAGLNTSLQEGLQLTLTPFLSCRKALRGAVTCDTSASVCKRLNAPKWFRGQAGVHKFEFSVWSTLYSLPEFFWNFQLLAWSDHTIQHVVLPRFA